MVQSQSGWAGKLRLQKLTVLVPSIKSTACYVLFMDFARWPVFRCVVKQRNHRRVEMIVSNFSFSRRDTKRGRTTTRRKISGKSLTPLYLTPPFRGIHSPRGRHFPSREISGIPKYICYGSSTCLALLSTLLERWRLELHRTLSVQTLRPGQR